MELQTSSYNPSSPGNRVLLVGPSLGGVSAHQWTKVAAELIDDVRTIFVELPGAGGPVWDDGVSPTLDELATSIAKIARKLRAEAGPDFACYFAGLSISGATGLHLARDYPELFDGVIVIASAATVGEPERWLERAAQVEATGTQQLVEETTKRWFTPAFRAEQPDTVAIIMEGLSAADDHSYAQLCRALAVHDLRPTMADIQIPVQLIAGERDSSTPLANIELVAESVARGELHIVEGAAHLVPVMKPVEVGGLIRSLIDRGPSSKVVSESED